jgi:hypothetical protein
VSKPVVLIAEELSPATLEALGPDFEIRRCNGADRAELLAAIGDVDAILGWLGEHYEETPETPHHREQAIAHGLKPATRG